MTPPANTHIVEFRDRGMSCQVGRGSGHHPRDSPVPWGNVPAARYIGQFQVANHHVIAVHSMQYCSTSLPYCTEHCCLQRQHVVNVHEVNHFSYDAAGAKQVAEALTNSVHVAAAAAAASVTAAAAADTAAAAVDASADATGGVDRVPRDEGGSCEGRCGTTLKLRFNLGKQLCYKLPPELWEEATRHGLDLQGLQVGCAGWGLHLACKTLPAEEDDILGFGSSLNANSAVHNGT